MEIEVQSRRRNGGVSDTDGLGVGRLVLRADDDTDRKLITSFYRCMGPPRPQTQEQLLADQAAAEHLRSWLAMAQSRINLDAKEMRAAKALPDPPERS